MSINRSRTRAQVDGPTTILVPSLLILVVFVVVVANSLQQSFGYSDLVALAIAAGMLAVSAVAVKVVSLISERAQEVRSQ